MFNILTIREMFQEWIPDYYYLVICQSLLIFLILFVICRILDVIYTQEIIDDKEEE